MGGARRIEKFHRDLKRLGFAEYREYLGSRRWKETRAAFLAVHPECFVCGTRERVEPHHRTYKRIGRERWRDYYRGDLVALCRRCHGLTHRAARYWSRVKGFDRENLGAAHTKVQDHWSHRLSPCGSRLCRELFPS